MENEGVKDENAQTLNESIHIIRMHLAENLEKNQLVHL